MKRVVLITTGQPTVNPRLVKEANILTQSGYEVIVIYSFWNQWASEADILLFKSVKWVPICAGGSENSNKILFLYTKFRQKLFNILVSTLTLKFGFAERAKARAFYELYKTAKKYQADIYIAHNLAALPIAVKVSKYFNTKCGFDAEDFHRFEESDNLSSPNYKISKYLEDKYFYKIDYLSTASPFISDEYKKLYPNLKPVTINNTFSKSYQSSMIKQNPTQGLKLFWFSQTIGKNRGLEDVIIALGKLNNKNITLTLLGSINDDTKNYFINLIAINKISPGKVIFLNPVPPEMIFQIASMHNIGLALEQTTPYNRNICITNKIFTYMISGIAIIATETIAQKSLLESNSEIGFYYKSNNISELCSYLNIFYSDMELLYKYCVNSYNLGKSVYNWEYESVTFINIIKQVLNEQND